MSQKDNSGGRKTVMDVGTEGPELRMDQKRELKGQSRAPGSGD